MDLNRKKEWLFKSLQLATLTAFAVAQPVYSVLLAEGAFFVGKSLQPVEVYLIVGLLSVVLPLLAAGVLMLAAVMHQKLAQGVYALGLTGLGALVAMPLLRDLQLPFEYHVPLQLALALIIGVVFSVLILRFQLLRGYLSFLWPVLLVFPVYFLTTYPDLKKEDLPAATVDADTPIVFLLFDEFAVIDLMNGNDQIDAERYPHFASLANEATWYKNAFTVHPYTSWAVPAIVTGQYPKTKKSGADKPPQCLNPDPSPEEYPVSLFSMLGGAYKLHVFEASIPLCPSQWCGAKQVDRFSAHKATLRVIVRKYISNILFRPAIFDPFFVSTKKTVLSDKPPDPVHRHDMASLEAMLEAMKQPGAGTRALYYYHPLFPHEQFEYYPSGKRYDPESVFLGEMFACGEENPPPLCEDAVLNSVLYQRHLLQVGYVDQMLGRIVEAMKANGFYDDAMIVITADHGVSFRAGELKRQISAVNYPEILSVPLFVKYPHQQTGRVETHPVQSVNIMPTVADVLKVSYPVETQALNVLVEQPRQSEVGSCTPDIWKTYKVDDILQGRQFALDQKIRWFGQGNQNPYDLYGFGPYKQWLGKSPPQAEAGKSAPYTVALETKTRQALEKLDTSAAFIQPLKIEGTLHVNTRAGSTPNDIAVVLNGTIASVTQTMPSADPGQRFFVAMIPEHLLKDGKNRIEVYALSGSSDSPRWIKLPLEERD